MKGGSSCYSINFWIDIGPPGLPGRILWIRVCLSVLPSICLSVLSRSFRGIGWLVFSGTQHDVRSSCGVVHDSQIFWKNGPKMDYKQGFLNLLENVVIIFFQNLFFNESLYLLYSCTNLIFGKNLVREIWARMLSVNQIAGFLYQLYL